MPNRYVLVFALLASTHPLQAIPEGLQTLSGDALAIASQEQLLVQCSDTAILSWDRFSIGRNEVVRFLQPDVQSVVLNRVRGEFDSQLLGSLFSNGKIFLVNPHGVLIGKEACIQTGGFLASSLDVLDEDFLARKELTFSGPSLAAVVNLGTISCLTGDVVLIGRTVVNEGRMVASQGDVLLAAGSEILIQPEGIERVFILAGFSPLDGSEAPLINEGEIEALSIELKSAVSNPYAKAIHSASSLISLSSFEEGGRIYLTADTGRVETTSSCIAEGGEVRILGDRVIVREGAAIDVSGEKGGGRVLIGGDYRGKNPEIKNAKIAVVEKGVQIGANARSQGDGGRVIIWSEETTGFFGSIDARGGPEGGNGGFVEISGGSFSFSGDVNTSAPQGATGDLLLDPNDITITTNATNPTFFNNAFYDGSNGMGGHLALANLQDTDLQNALGNSNVTIQTDQDAGAAGGSGNIEFQTSISWISSNALTCVAFNQIILDNAGAAVALGNANSTSELAFNFTAQGYTGGGVPIFSAIRLGIGSSITATRGAVLLNGFSGAGASMNAGVELQNSAQILTTGGAIHLLGIISQNPASASGNIGVYIHNGASITSTGGGSTQKDVSIIGKSTGGADANIGVWIDSDVTIACGTQLSDTTGSIYIEGSHFAGMGESLGGGNMGVLIQDLITEGQGIVTRDGHIYIIGAVGLGATSQGGGHNRGIEITGSPFAASISRFGNLTLEGFGGFGSDECDGVAVIVSSGLFAEEGSITILGTGGGVTAGTATNSGVLISGSTVQLQGSLENNSAIFLEGKGSSSLFATGDFNIGVEIESGAVLNSGVKDLFVFGEGGTSGIMNNWGVNISGTITIGGSPPSLTASSGDIHITGYGGSGNASHGVRIGYTPAGVDFASISITGSGSISIYGESSTSSITANGVNLFTNARISSSGDGISILGIGRGTDSSEYGVQITDAIIASTAAVSGTVSIEGIGSTQASGGSNHGVFISTTTNTPSLTPISTNDCDLLIIGRGGLGDGGSGIVISATTEPTTIGSTGDGSILLSGIGGNGAATACHGISLSGVTSGMSHTQLSTSTGSIFLTGISGQAGLGSSSGILMDQYEITGGGNLSLNGQSTASLTTNHGIAMSQASVISTGGAGSTLLLVGIGSPSGTNTNLGIQIESSLTGLASISAGDAAISLLGIGRGSGTGNIGVEMANTATIQATGTNTIHLEGRGAQGGTSSNTGVYIHDGSSVLTTGNAMVVRAESGNGTANALLIEDAASLESVGSGLMDVTTRSFAANGGDLVVTNGSFINSQETGSIQLNVARDLTITGGTAADTGILCFQSPGQLPTGSLTAIIGRDLTLTGSSAASGTVELGSNSDDTTLTVGRNVILTGGSGAGASVQVGGQFGSGNIVFESIGGNLTLTGDGYALIGNGNSHTGSVVALDLTGDIIFRRIVGNVVIQGGSSATLPYAQIGHVNPPTTTVTFSGDILMTANGSVTLTGGTSAGSYAQIGHGGQAGSPTFDATSITVFSGTDMTLTSDTGLAQIVNDSTTAGSGRITLIVDDLNPLNPDAGATGFTMNSTAVIRNQYAVSGGQVRLYTVTPSQNGLVAGQDINGGAFPAGPLSVNSDYEIFAEYYGSGSYTGPEFVVYYKLSDSGSPFFTPIYLAQIALSELSDRLPIFNGFYSNYFKTFYSRYYHSRVCPVPTDQDNQGRCVPGYYRFYPFIFESDVY